MADEKNLEKNLSQTAVVNSSDSQLSGINDDGQEITWTEAEEKALVRRYAAPECRRWFLEKGVSLTTGSESTSLSCHC